MVYCLGGFIGMCEIELYVCVMISVAMHQSSGLMIAFVVAES